MADPVLGPVNIGDVCLVSYFGRLAGQRIINTHHYRVTDAPVSPVTVDWWVNYAEMQTALSGAVNLTGTFLDSLSNEYTLEFIRLQKLLPTRVMFRDVQKNLTGSIAGAASPPNTAVSVERKGQNADRHSIGRVQLAGPVAANVAAGEITNAYRLIINDFADRLKQNFVTAGGVTLEPVLLGYTLPPVVVPVVTPVVATKTFIEVRTMHRRTVGLGI